MKDLLPRILGLVGFLCIISAVMAGAMLWAVKPPYRPGLYQPFFFFHLVVYTTLFIVVRTKAWRKGQPFWN